MHHQTMKNCAPNSTESTNPLEYVDASADPTPDGPGSHQWGGSPTTDGLLLLSRSILPLCGSWGRLSGEGNTAWGSSEYRATLTTLVTSCLERDLELPQELMVKVSFLCAMHRVVCGRSLVHV